MNRLALIHGFGMPMTVFDPLMAQLTDCICTNIALPGDCQPSDASGIDAYIDFIAAQITTPTYLLGWSIGGMLALALTRRQPEFIRGLILVASTPKFIQTDNWQFAVKSDSLDAFYQDISANYPKTIKQFLTLQTHQMPDQKAVIKTLSATINPHPDTHALKAQLHLLQSLDLRDALPHIDTSTLWLAGRLDTLCPPKASEAGAQMMPNACVHVFEHSGHLPFISHQHAFVEKINQWLRSQAMDKN